MPSSYRIGVDGGGSKTELILIDQGGAIIARHLAPGCNPSVAGPECAREIVVDALAALLAGTKIEQPKISTTLLCMAGSRAFWKETASALTGYGAIETDTDAAPVLELATGGGPGLVVHAGTGSFVALRDPEGGVRYAGGLGWRIGDAGSALDIGRRAVGRALAELQGWSTRSALSVALQDLYKTSDAGAITAALHRDSEPNYRLGVFAAAVSLLAQSGDATARDIILAATGDLIACAEAAAKAFLGSEAAGLPAGLSGPILTQTFVVDALGARTKLLLRPLKEPPIEGVRRLLLRAP